MGESAVKIWEPSPEVMERARVTHFMRWAEAARGVPLPDYHALWRWSVEDLEGFWGAVWEYFQVGPKPPGPVLADRQMPGARWFPGTRVNFAREVFRQARPGRPAVWYIAEDGPLHAMTWDALATAVANLAHRLRSWGVGPGDRVAAYLSNVPEAVVAFLATASIGAIWSVASPDFGTSSVISRFQQIQPKVLLLTDGYRYQGRVYARRDEATELRRALADSVERTIWVPKLDDSPPPPDAVEWAEVVKGAHPLSFVDLPFEHPLWILYSSGTTGLPKAIVHSHGGIVVEELVNCAFHQDLGPGDRFFWFTTTSWVIWNLVVSALLVGSEIVLYDGSPLYPDAGAMWALVERAGITSFGTSAAYLGICQKQDLWPGRTYDLKSLRAISSSGSPLSPEGFHWVYERVKSDVWLASTSGGTDICGPLVGGIPILPVYAGEIQCRALGVKAEAWDESGQPVTGAVGELVVTEPIPSMPIYFWNDPDGARYRESYFEWIPGVWRHGDWIQFTDRGTAVIHGRSDSTINRQGVRLGTSEIYRVVEALPEVADSLVVDLEWVGRPSFMALFVVPAPGVALDDMLRQRIAESIRRELSPRFVPDSIYAVEAIPRTLNGKKLEVPIKRLLLGVPVARAVNLDAIQHPEVIPFFEALGRTLSSGEAVR